MYIRPCLGGILALCLTVAACQSGTESESNALVTEEAELVDGVQVVRIEVTASGYRPQRIQLQEGVPTRLIFHRTVEGECPEQVQIPDFGVEKTTLPLNQDHAVEFTPTKSGEFTFACSMDMLQGTLVVES